jgi:hypothetical protein
LWQSSAPVNLYRLLWLLVPLLGLAELAAHIHVRDATPAPEDWMAIEPSVRNLWRPGDLLVAAPYWAEPNLRAVFGDDLMRLRDVARADDSGYRRAIEVSIVDSASVLRFGTHGAAWRQWRAESNGMESNEEQPWRLIEEHDQGPFTLRVWENPLAKVPSLDFVNALSPNNASVLLARKGKEHSCSYNPSARVKNGALHGHPTFPKQRFQCGKSDWNFVGVTVIEDQDYRPRRCIWAHPVKGKTLVIRFKDVALGQQIAGFGGLPWFSERDSKRSDVTLTVHVEGNELGGQVHKDGDGWKPFVVDTSPYAGQRHDVEFHTRAKRTSKREFCFQADVR